MTTITDPDLILLARFRESGDAAAFGEIVRRYAAAVFATCHRILHDPGSAEDATQETFFRLMTRPGRVESSVGGWLHRAATRLALDIQRSENSRRRREAAYEATQVLDASSWAEVVPQLDAAIAALPDESRELLVRHFLRGESQADLAAEQGTSPATLSRRMKDAVDSLREELSRKGVSVAPVLLYKLMAQNGTATVSPALKLALGKMSLYCTAKQAVVRTDSWVRTIGGIPKAAWELRWAIAAATLSIVVSIAAMSILRQAQWPGGGGSGAGAASKGTPEQVELRTVALNGLPSVSLALR